MVKQLDDESLTTRGFASVAFLFGQRMIVWPSLIVALACIAFGTLMTIDAHYTTWQTFAVLIAIALVCGFGATMLTVLPGFFVWRALTMKKPVFVPRPDEKTLLTRAANHFLRHEGRGGTLVISNQRVVFLPHRFNFQMDERDIPLPTIVGVSWRRIVHPYTGLVMSSTVQLQIGGANGHDEVFVVTNAEAVAGQIDALLAPT